jgi:hypothetical protein
MEEFCRRYHIESIVATNTAERKQTGLKKKKRQNPMEKLVLGRLKTWSRRRREEHGWSGNVLESHRWVTWLFLQPGKWP